MDKQLTQTLRTVTELINTLPDNNYVTWSNIIDETVFSVSTVSSNSRNGVLCDQLLGYATVITIDLCFLCGPCRGYITRFPVEAESNTSILTLRVVGSDEKGSL
jgi:hypothetical protein